MPSQMSSGLREGESLAQTSQIRQPIVLETKGGNEKEATGGFCMMA